MTEYSDRHGGDSRASFLYRALVSTFVGFVLVFQAIVSLGPIVGLEIGTRFWPIVNYAMYSRSFKEGDTVEVYRILEGVTVEGDRVDLSMETVGMHLWQYRDLARDLERGNPDALAFVRSFVPEGSALGEIRLKSFPVAVSRDGPVEKDSEVLMVISVDQQGGEQ